MPARANQSGTISFGLVSIPVKFFPSASSEQVRFNMLHKGSGARVKQQLVRQDNNEVVPRSDIIKGYEYSKGMYVTFDEDELKALETTRDTSINIVEFIPLDTFDPIQVEKSYYLAPDKGGDKAYGLLALSMLESKKVAIGRWAARGKEQLIVIRPYKDGLIFHQMYYSDEVRPFEELDTGAHFQYHEAEKALAKQLIEQLTVDEFRVEKYEDSFRERVLAAVEQKVAGQKLQLAPEAPKAQIIDLVEALKQSLEGTGEAEAATGTDGALAPSVSPCVPSSEGD